jgi:tetratricopeptide (TPR) repeat protein
MTHGAPPEGLAGSSLPQQVEWTETPFFAQSAYQCGPAALATVLAHRGIPVTLDALVDEVYLPARRGSLQIELRAAARARGLVAYPLRPELDALLTEVAAGNPVLVLQNIGLAVAPRWHYAVVYGYDLTAGELLLRSGTIERHALSLRRFDRSWARGERWAFVAMPPEQLPATAEPMPWLRAVNELEQTGALAAARLGYETAIAAWPEVAIGHLGLANTRHAMGDHAGAEQVLRGLLALDPRRHEAWNNLAHVLAARACGPQARAAAQCATLLAPQAEVYQRTELMAQAVPNTAGPCAPPPPCPAIGLLTRIEADLLR